MSLQKTQLQPQNWRKWYLTTQSLPSDDFASTSNKDDSVTPNISAHKHTMQFLRTLFTDLRNNGRTVKTWPFSKCVRRTSASKTGPEMALDQKISVTHILPSCHTAKGVSIWDNALLHFPAVLPAEICSQTQKRKATLVLLPGHCKLGLLSWAPYHEPGSDTMWR